MTQAPAPDGIDLSGTWILSDASGDYSCDATIPGDAISALASAGLIPDPYWGRNEYGLRWIADRDWTIRRTVDLDDTGLALVLSGLDTVVTVRWNGETVLEATNSFRSYRVDLGDVARPGSNTVEIVFHSSTAAADALQAAQPFYIPYQASNSPIPNGNMLRKVQCDYGWDWNIALAPFGLYGDIRLEQLGAPRIPRIDVVQDHGQGTVSLGVTVHVEDAEDAEDEEYAITFAGQTLTGIVEGPAVSAWFDIENPALWWPAGQGPQPLHELTVTVGGTAETRRIGLRTVELLTDPDPAGSRFAFRVNGREVFMKGANWIPADALAGRIDRDAVRGLLQSAVDANMNMIRVWGGGRYEPTWFYDLCDEMGLMVWQDFMFSCNLYPSTPAFLAEVRAEVAENVARMHHHACIALWCGDNELVGALTWFPESVKDRDRYLVNYDRLNRTIEETLKATDPTAIWWPSSPCPGPLNFGDSWHDDGNGDMHFWSVWHEGRDFEHYRDVSPRFCSEFGFQSYPSIQAIRRFAGPEDMNIAAPVLESHQKNAGGNARIAETMFRYFRWPEKFEDFVWLSQIQQGLAIKTAVEHWRSLKPHCMGTLIWQLNDTWPVCSWSSLDHGGGWKMLHYMARDFYAPVRVVVRPEVDAWEIVAINDRPEPARVTVEVTALDMSGRKRVLAELGATIEAEAEMIGEIALDALEEGEVMVIDWTGPMGRSSDIFAPKPWKTYMLNPPGIALAQTRNDDGVWTVELSAETAPAFFVTVEADVPGRFSDAAFHMTDSTGAALTFVPADPSARPAFTLRHLHAATTA
ncbi:beta-mannosidase [Roseisalinus antarcticus]|uniref:beta-mannosidase n=1 Tax=Roseisalinus antarcticus TaxID=254357 RepID=A0A1Y5T938_9RHOB|nr:glycoside hydrolase family 2 protein [Roseisalinus antarcticus]SLN58497.1 Exo-beta-D-glucosaminidase precursor [Roseisalinus antarcticus]